MNKTCFVLILAVVHFPTTAQQAPDAGQTLQQLQPRMELAPPSNPDIPSPKPSIPSVPEGGQQVEIKQIEIVGNDSLPEQGILSSLGHIPGQSYDLAGLRQLAYQVVVYYNKAGYPFVNALLPEQDLTQGVLRIQVLEGKYGSIHVSSDNPKLQEQGYEWLANLQPGNVIHKDELERTLLLLDEQPGIKTFNTLSPSQQAGAGDLNVGIVEDSPIQARFELDNHGNRYTGYQRAQSTLNFYNNLNLGDELAMQVLHTSESLSLGTLSFSSPIGTSGLRGKAGYAVTQYQLGREFATSQASGEATELSVEVSYRLIRTQQSSWTIRGGVVKKHLRDENINGEIGKSSVSFPLGVQFYELGDTGGALTFGSLSWTKGKLQAPAGNDVLNTIGQFDKYNLNLIRLQPLSRNYTLYLNYSQQVASRNLDSSEGYGLGGVAGVRAYPSGEASGDEFWLTQVEFRYLTGAYTPFGFYDFGSSKSNAVGPSPSRSIAGVGLGLRYQQSAWSAEATMAWRTTGGPPQADTSRDPTPRIWLKISYRFI